MKIIFIRHGEPDYSCDSLTEKGKREADILAKRTALWDVDDIYVSPFGRAKETAAPTLSALSKEATELSWLREFSYQVTSPVVDAPSVPWDFIPSVLYGDERLLSEDEWITAPPMDGNSDIKENYPKVIAGLDELIEKYGYERKGKYYVRKDGCERFIKSTVTDMKFATIDMIEDNPDEKTIVVFCHLGVICLMLSHLLNIPFESLTHGFFLPTTSVTIVNTEERWGSEVSFRVQAMGDCTHLIKEGEPISNAGSFAKTFQD